ncbi:MAG: RelA/SpoT family protein, partial [Proteobacteria bacterium]|nr:RelA/SpoT family protein [Pseudomonadota bacterium]
MIRINDILDKIAEYNPEADLDIIERAYVYSARVHDGQTRLSGEPYLSHPLEVAGILADMKLDVVSVAASLLHDVIEDTHATLEEIKGMFGDDITNIVSGVTKLSVLPFDGSQARQAESIRKMILAMADDIRVILIKLADRLHNMRTLKFHSESKRIKIAKETLDIYAPIAARLGIYWIKKELEDTSFMYLQPEEYERIRNLVNTDREARDQYIQTVKSFLEKNMDGDGLKCEILGRYKYYYSIYQKMIKQGLAFEEVYDIIAFRIILDTIPKCYEALGIVHSLWKPVSGKFKDYIGVPKPNMYQSLHTTVIGSYGERIEIQIRTHEMDKVAQAGIAAHWSYKEGRSFDENINKTFAWIQNLVENQENIRDPDEFLENVRIDLFPDEVYVFTPQGEIKTLPKGATPIDFAFQIHTELGLRLHGCTINGVRESIFSQLKTGDRVEVFSADQSCAKIFWKEHINTPKARMTLQSHFHRLHNQLACHTGRVLLEHNVPERVPQIFSWIKEQEMVQTEEEMYEKIGKGEISLAETLSQMNKPNAKGGAFKDFPGLLFRWIR